MDIVGAAKAAGADAVEVAFSTRAALSVSVRMGELEEVEREESGDLGIRVLIGRRQASVSGSDISREGRAKLVERVAAMAALAAEDPYVGLPSEERLARGGHADLDLYDPGSRSRKISRPRPSRPRTPCALSPASPIPTALRRPGRPRRGASPRARASSVSIAAASSRCPPRPSPARVPAWSRATRARPRAGVWTCPRRSGSAPRPVGARCRAWERERSTRRRRR